jgi:hypothetical protein
MSASIVAQADLRDQLVSWEWISRRYDQIWDATVSHLWLTVFAVGVGLVISVALSSVALRWRRTYAPITWFTGFLYTIPSLALFAFLVPVMGLGFYTAQVALVSYTLLILIRNIVAGVDGVPASVKEAADGMGYSPCGGSSRSTSAWPLPPSSPASASPRSRSWASSPSRCWWARVGTACSSWTGCGATSRRPSCSASPCR